ncbi:MAG TPA: hypothetical protein EYG85_05130 [Crocinitomix sp.]|nr:hypothetical protein [Crocinitomix sp.]
MKNISFLTILGLFLLFSCNNTEEDTQNIDDLTDTVTVQQIDSTTIEIDTTSVLPDSLQEAGYVDESEENEKEIEKKYGKQWDFCDCVVKNDSINKVFEKDLSDEDFDKAFARSAEIDKHCKELITAPNTTPDERARHKRKVRKCLKAAGIK